MKCRNFLEATNGESIHLQSTFRIKDIEFECVLCPNGLNSKSVGWFKCYLVIKTMPSNIEYVIISSEVGCDSTSRKSKWVKRFGQVVKEVL